jgi:hypothetical protein
MENRATRAFSVSPATAPIVITALRQMASSMMKCDGVFKVERWDERGVHVEEVLASASNALIAKGAAMIVRRASEQRVQYSPPSGKPRSFRMALVSSVTAAMSVSPISARMHSSQ